MTDHRPDTDPGRAVVDECTALLEGHAGELLGIEGRPRPAWAWLNLPSHGSMDDLMALVDGTVDPPPRSWQAVRLEVCRFLLDLAGTDAALLEVQRSALIPLELELLARHVDVRDPEHLAAVVGQRLGAERRLRVRS